MDFAFENPGEVVGIKISRLQEFVNKAKAEGDDLKALALARRISELSQVSIKNYNSYYFR